MKFFFDYIYYRITQWKFETQGSNSPTAVGFISVMQTFLLALILIPLSKHFFDKNELTVYSKQLGMLGAGTAILLMFINYKIHNGRYEKYLEHWQYESKTQRIFKGILVIISVASPIIIFGLINTHWHK